MPVLLSGVSPRGGTLGSSLLFTARYSILFRQSRANRRVTAKVVFLNGLDPALGLEPSLFLCYFYCSESDRTNTPSCLRNRIVINALFLFRLQGKAQVADSGQGLDMRNRWCFSG